MMWKGTIRTFPETACADEKYRELKDPEIHDHGQLII